MCGVLGRSMMATLGTLIPTQGTWDKWASSSLLLLTFVPVMAAHKPLTIAAFLKT